MMIVSLFLEQKQLRRARRAWWERDSMAKQVGAVGVEDIPVVVQGDPIAPAGSDTAWPENVGRCLVGVRALQSKDPSAGSGSVACGVVAA